VGLVCRLDMREGVPAACVGQWLVVNAEEEVMSRAA
jgi:hypothetical protein